MIKIITDTAADIPPEILSEKNIVAVPLGVYFYKNNTEMSIDSVEEFWKTMAADTFLPKTSAPSPGSFAESFATAQSEGYEGVICITLASELSGTYEAALVGAQEVKNFPIEVIDSKSVTLGEGLLVLFASELANNGLSFQEIVDATCKKREKIKILALLDTLEYLKLGGRIGALSSMIGTLLSVKPIIEIKFGALSTVSKQRTRSRGIDFLTDLLKTYTNLEKVAVVHSMAPDIDSITESVTGILGTEDVLTSYIGPIVGTYSGPGTIGFCLMEK
ncbi:MAG: DegV family protein [Firmicutes bacterium]|jgi:DegV family protein with EDD domain|nr:DegV family protein [Bacillota bacterium]